MEPTRTLMGCTHWQPAFEELLRAVEGGGAEHGQLIDIREAIRGSVGPGRPLVMLCPHADDGAITAACLIHDFAVRRGMPVIEVLVFTGERNVAAPWLNDKKKVSVREAEFRLECQILGAEAVTWELDAYRSPGYRPTPRDVDKIVEWFLDRKPGALIVPPATDAHVAHRTTRGLAAMGLVGASLTDTLVLTGWTPWGPLPRPNAFFPYDAEAERTKDWAIHCHASQVRLTDYTEFCTHLGRAYAELTREWAEGHKPRGRSPRDEDSFVGVELFQIETYDPNRAYLNLIDPIQIALGILAGRLDPVTARDAAIATGR
jgi:LmbE family N-acetylglucosaminyl deacetylase